MLGRWATLASWNLIFVAPPEWNRNSLFQIDSRTLLSSQYGRSCWMAGDCDSFDQVRRSLKQVEAHASRPGLRFLIESFVIELLDQLRTRKNLDQGRTIPGRIPYSSTRTAISNFAWWAIIPRQGQACIYLWTGQWLLELYLYLHQPTTGRSTPWAISNIISCYLSESELIP